MIEPSIPSLGHLSDPHQCTEPLVITGESPEGLISELRTMLTIRLVEEKIGDQVKAGKIACPCHLGIGQEAVAVGVSRYLRSTDRVFGGHRSHSHYLALGGTVYGLFAEVLGKESGCSKGMGGSMHLYDGARGFIGSVPIVAATVPLAVGAALAAQKDKKGDVAVSYFGDGSAEEGCVHEALNLAAVFKLPILFVCENNFFSSHLHINLRQPSNSVARYAAAHAIPYSIVDGNDVAEVARESQKLITRSREGGGPGFLEAVTYRWRGHVGPSEDIDVGVARKQDLGLWKQRDPVRRLVDALKAQNAFSDELFQAMRQEVSALVNTEWSRAEAAPFPETTALLDRVYSRES